MAFAKFGTVPSENALNAVIYARYSSTQQNENSYVRIVVTLAPPIPHYQNIFCLYTQTTLSAQ